MLDIITMVVEICTQPQLVVHVIDNMTTVTGESEVTTTITEIIVKHLRDDIVSEPCKLASL